MRVPKNIFESETQSFLLGEGAKALPKAKAKPSAKPHARNILTLVDAAFMLPNDCRQAMRDPGDRRETRACPRSRLHLACSTTCYLLRRCSLEPLRVCLVVSVPGTEGRVGRITKQELQRFLNHMPVAEQHVQLPTMTMTHPFRAPQMILR